MELGIYIGVVGLSGMELGIGLDWIRQSCDTLGYLRSFIEAGSKTNYILNVFFNSMCHL
jgi:hypothetical protein